VHHELIKCGSSVLASRTCVNEDEDEKSPLPRDQKYDRANTEGIEGSLERLWKSDVFMHPRFK
jgi:hypothetical protein